MRYFYLLLALFFTTLTVAQTNLSFEDWDNDGNPEVWDLFGTGISMNELTDIGDVTDGQGTLVIPITQMSDVPTDGDHYVRLTSFDMSNSFDPNQFPDQAYGAIVYQKFNDPNQYIDVSFDAKGEWIGTDLGVFIVNALDASGNLVGQGIATVSGSQPSFQSYTATINYVSLEPITAYEIIICSSLREVIENWQGQPAPAIQPGSIMDVDNIQLGQTVITPPNVSNVVASDIGNNGNGTDLQVTFDVPSDETGIAAYHLIVFRPNLNPGMLQGAAAFIAEYASATLTPDGTNKTHVFSATDNYWQINTAGNAIDSILITNDVDFRVWVYVQGANGFGNVFEGSNVITLKDEPLSILENNWVTRVFPNPVADLLFFETDNLNIASVQIIDLKGASVISSKVNATSGKIDVSGLENGVYLFQGLDEANNILISKKIMVK
ncbi:MAG: T9SS type A sorting domain-containing protein [Crocinitomicaceae bacterium]|nr:T9SS type A sorting domain-containing protein [Crocinitomicaceae bacterium]